jgi:hypothetical protein
MAKQRGQRPHHYIITVIAADSAPDALKPGLTRDALLAELKGHALVSTSQSVVTPTRRCGKDYRMTAPKTVLRRLDPLRTGVPPPSGSAAGLAESHTIAGHAHGNDVSPRES